MRALRREAAALAILAGPVVVTQLAYVASAATDAVMAGRLGTEALAATGLGLAVWVPTVTFIGGVLHLLVPQVAAHVASGTSGAAGRAAVQGAWLGVLLSLAVAVLLALVAPALFRALEVDPAVVGPASDYLRAVCLGLPCYGLWTAARFFCDGHGDTRPAMLAAVGTAILNVPLNLFLMFDSPLGPGTGAGLGVTGAGLATAGVLLSGAMAMTGWTLRSSRYASARTGVSLRPDPAAMLGLLRSGTPIGLSLLVRYSVMSAIAVAVGRVGAEALASHQVAYNVSLALFMLPVSISMAATIRVAACLGGGDVEGARRATGAALLLGLGVSGLAAVAIIMLPGPIVALYTPDPVVRDMAARLLLLAAGFHLLDAMQTILTGALRGRSDVMVPCLVSLAAYWLVAMPLGAVIVPAVGVAAWWWGLIAATAVIATAIALRTSRQFGT